MKRIFRLGLPLISMAALSVGMLTSCSNNVLAKNVYVNDVDGRVSIEFKKDNTAVLFCNVEVKTGDATEYEEQRNIQLAVCSYRVQDNILFLNVGSINTWLSSTGVTIKDPPKVLASVTSLAGTTITFTIQDDGATITSNIDGSVWKRD